MMKAIRFWKALALFLGAVAYGVSPIDAIPDLIPVLGLADDVVVFVSIAYFIWRIWAKRSPKRAVQRV